MKNTLPTFTQLITQFIHQYPTYTLTPDTSPSDTYIISPSGITYYLEQDFVTQQITLTAPNQGLIYTTTPQQFTPLQLHQIILQSEKGDE